MIKIDASSLAPLWQADIHRWDAVTPPRLDSPFRSITEESNHGDANRVSVGRYGPMAGELRRCITLISMLISLQQRTKPPAQTQQTAIRTKRAAKRAPVLAGEKMRSLSRLHCFSSTENETLRRKLSTSEMWNFNYCTFIWDQVTNLFIAPYFLTGCQQLSHLCLFDRNLNVTWF